VRAHVTSALPFFAALALLFIFALELRAQPAPGSAASSLPPTDAAELGLSLAVAKVAVNEASLQRLRPAEVALVWQVTEARGETHERRLRWLRAHSSCVLGDREIEERERTTNCVWTRNLRASDAEPAGWPDGVPWSRYVRRWAQVREYAARLVAGDVISRPCPGRPWTWGGRRIDMARALERGLVPLGCRDPHTGELTLNEGFALRSDS
jgi:hypothetical protein